MEDIKEIADQLEMPLKRVMVDADAVDPAPQDYFLISDLKKDEHWILGFSFKTKEDLRLALENGVCYKIHDFVFKSVTQSEQLGAVKSYIVFVFGEVPETDADQLEQHDKVIAQLDALQLERESGEFGCGLCAHSLDDHLMMGHPMDGEAAATEGWMICANRDCTCFRTWSLNEGQG